MPPPKFEQVFVSGIQQFSSSRCGVGVGLSTFTYLLFRSHLFSSPWLRPPALSTPQMGMCAAEKGFVTPGRWLDSPERRIASAAID